MIVGLPPLGGFHGPPQGGTPTQTLVSVFDFGTGNVTATCEFESGSFGGDVIGSTADGETLYQARYDFRGYFISTCDRSTAVLTPHPLITINDAQSQLLHAIYPMDDGRLAIVAKDGILLLDDPLAEP